MKSEEIELREEELLFIKSLENKLNVSEYSELRNIIQKYIQLARNENWEAQRYKERYEKSNKKETENYNKYCEEEKEKQKWQNYYKEVCNKYAKLEIELDLAKAKIKILEEKRITEQH